MEPRRPLGLPFRPSLGFLCLGLFALAWEAPLHAAGPPVPDLPADLPEFREVAGGEHGWWSRETGDDNLGVGLLRPSDETPGWGADWIGKVRLPVYDGPAGEPAGWLVGGWWVPARASDEPEALSIRRMIEFTYETVAWVVLDIHPDGWFRLDFSLAGSREAYELWGHDSHLALGEIHLTLETWERFFLANSETGSLSPLFFRRREIPHALRQEPRTDSPRVAGILSDHILEPLEIRGDWMRVRATQPSDYCHSGEWEGRKDLGWVRWRSPEKGPWLWFFSRGC